MRYKEENEDNEAEQNSRYDQVVNVHSEVTLSRFVLLSQTTRILNECCSILRRLY